jgi:5-methylcytosine-specific restriction endonuclease McrA
MDKAADPGQVILDEIAALEVVRARTEAQIAARMLDFHDLRRRQAEGHADPRRRDLEVSFAADELGVTLHQPTRTVQCRLAEARRVRGRLPLTWLTFTAGRIDAHRLSLIAAAVDQLRRDNHAVIELDHLVGDKAAQQTTAQRKGWLKRFVARNAPDTEAALDARDKRAVWTEHQEHGMSFLHAYIPTCDAVRIERRLTDRARQVPHDGRTIDHQRADELCDLLLGDGAGGGRAAIIGITVPITSLAGLTDQPGESFDGSFALPADLVRDLAAEPGTLFHRILTDPLGRILDITELGRFASTQLTTGIDIRDGTCRFPTCSRPATECDKDHEIPHPRGPTSSSNLRALCRRHHNLKTHRITEPTAHAMRAPTRSPVEHDLAVYAVRLQYAA